MTFTRPSLNLDIWSARLQSLETRTSKLVEDYDSIMNRVEVLEHKTVCQTGMMDREKRLMGVVDLLMRDDVRANVITDYVTVFFRLILIKLREHGHDYEDLRQLSRALGEEDVAKDYRRLLTDLGFPDSEQNALSTVLEALQYRPWQSQADCTEVLTSSPAGDAQISSALIYLRSQHDLDHDVNASLRRSVCVAHESVVSDTAVSEEGDITSFETVDAEATKNTDTNDINYNALEVTGDVIVKAKQSDSSVASSTEVVINYWNVKGSEVLAAPTDACSGDGGSVDEVSCTASSLIRGAQSPVTFDKACNTCETAKPSPGRAEEGETAIDISENHDPSRLIEGSLRREVNNNIVFVHDSETNTDFVGSVNFDEVLGEDGSKTSVKSPGHGQLIVCDECPLEGLLKSEPGKKKADATTGTDVAVQRSNKTTHNVGVSTSFSKLLRVVEPLTSANQECGTLESVNVVAIDCEEMDTVVTVFNGEKIETVTKTDIHGKKIKTVTVDGEEVETVTTEINCDEIETVTTAIDGEEVGSVTTAIHGEKIETVTTAFDDEDVETVTKAITCDEIETVTTAIDGKEMETVTTATHGENTGTVTTALVDEEIETVTTILNCNETETVMTSIDGQEIETVTSATHGDKTETVTAIFDDEHIASVITTLNCEEIETVTTSVDGEELETVTSATHGDNTKTVTTSFVDEHIESVTTTLNCNEIETVTTSVDGEEIETVTSDTHDKKLETFRPSLTDEAIETITTAINCEEIKTVTTAINCEEIKTVTTAVNCEEIKTVTTAVNCEEIKTVTTDVDVAQIDTATSTINCENTVVTSFNFEEVEIVTTNVNSSEVETIAVAASCQEVGSVSTILVDEKVENVSNSISNEDFDTVSVVTDDTQVENVTDEISYEKIDTVTTVVNDRDVDVVSYEKIDTVTTVVNDVDVVSSVVSYEEIDTVTTVVNDRDVDVVSSVVSYEGEETVLTSIKAEDIETYTVTEETENQVGSQTLPVTFSDVTNQTLVMTSSMITRCFDSENSALDFSASQEECSGLQCQDSRKQRENNNVRCDDIIEHNRVEKKCCHDNKSERKENIGVDMRQFQPSANSTFVCTAALDDTANFDLSSILSDPSLTIIPSDFDSSNQTAQEMDLKVEDCL